jgi:NAD(P)-dependent dehydrogenase (short-subunit alcohol dehydrogenase family)
VAQAAADEITAAGGKAVAVAAAVGSSPAAQALVDAAVEAFGRLDVLVANAGVLRDKVVWKMTDEDFDLVTQVHLKGTFTCARAAIVRMKEQGEGGRLILIGSPAGQYGNFGQTNYAAAKAGIVTFAKVWAMELSRDKITANAVVPVAATAMTATVPFLKPYVDAMAAGEPMPEFARRELAFGTPEDVAGLVVYLASDASAGGQRPGHRHRRRPPLALLPPRPDRQGVCRRRLERRRYRRRLAGALRAQRAQSVGETLPTPPAT